MSGYHCTGWVIPRLELGYIEFLLQDGEERTAISKYKIQPGTNAPLSRRRFLELISLVSFNQLIVGGVAQGGNSIGLKLLKSFL